MTTFESIQKCLRIADDWRKKENLGWESLCVGSAVMDYVQVAVQQQGDPDSGAKWLTDHGFVTTLKRRLDLLHQVCSEVDAGRLPSSVIANMHKLSVYAHAAWCVDEFELGESFVAIAQREDVTKVPSRFWREYTRGMDALVHGAPYQVEELKLGGLERHWVQYLRLIEAVCSGQPTDQALAEVDKWFAKRNRDKRLKGDSYQIEGSADRPVNWDFRRCGLVKYIAHRQKT